MSVSKTAQRHPKTRAKKSTKKAVEKEPEAPNNLEIMKAGFKVIGEGAGIMGQGFKKTAGWGRKMLKRD